MQYSRLYKKLVNRCLKDKRKASDPRYTVHHILPRSMGGLDEEGNRVLMTPKEHYIAHRLLAHSYKKKHPEVCYLLNTFSNGMKGCDSPKLSNFNFYASKVANYRKSGGNKPKNFAQFVKVAKDETVKMLNSKVDKEKLIERLFTYTF